MSRAEWAEQALVEQARKCALARLGGYIESGNLVLAHPTTLVEDSNRELLWLVEKLSRAIIADAISPLADAPEETP
jgi:hypothetical protein